MFNHAITVDKLNLSKIKVYVHICQVVSPVVKPKGTGLVEKLVELLLILLYFGFAVLGLALVLSRAKESYNFIQKVPWVRI